MNADFQNMKSVSMGEAAGFIKYRAVLVETHVDGESDSLESKLADQNVELVAILHSATNLASMVAELDVDVLILAVDFLDAQTLEQLIKLNKNDPLPVVAFARQHAPEVMKTVVDAGVSSYVVDDVQAHRIPVIIDLAVVRFAKMNSLNSELQQTKEKLSERKLIEKAKGILMQQKHLSEGDAYAQMRKSAMNQGQSIAELARRIIDVFEMLD